MALEANLQLAAHSEPLVPVLLERREGVEAKDQVFAGSLLKAAANGSGVDLT